VQTRLPNESQVRPALLRIDGTWHMWFSYRGSVDFRAEGETYRLGYARSDDLETWERNDEAAGITVTSGDWDSQMMCYPNIVRVDDRIFMFYNGNGFGERGFGYAVLQP
jgi:sucrose-6-phosphate hydrolase SacC (GH32 family)